MVHISQLTRTPPTCGAHSINRWPTVLDKSALYGSSQIFCSGCGLCRRRHSPHPLQNILLRARQPAAALHAAEKSSCELPQAVRSPEELRTGAIMKGTRFTLPLTSTSSRQDTVFVR